MATVARPKLRRQDLKPGEVLCEYCTAKCCRYFALAIDDPQKRDDWETIRWYLLHEAASMFREDDAWYLLVQTVCKHLQADNRCGIYETRPTICREYSTEGCEYEDEFLYEQYLETAQQVAEYVEAIFPPQRGQSIRSARPPLLPVIEAPAECGASCG